MNIKTIKKVEQIFKLGHVPCRGNEHYGKTFMLANCFEHACINLSDKQIEEFGITDKDSTEFGNFFRFTKDSTAEQMLKTLANFGLKVEKCPPEKIVEKNQWLIALYFECFYQINKDFHLLIREPNGTWTGKVGYTPECHSFDNLPNVVDSDIRFYELFNTYCITNPYAEKEKTK